MSTKQDEFSARISAALQSTDRERNAVREAQAEAARRAAEENRPGASPVGVGERIVRESECTSSIAKETGHFWKTIWLDPRNAKLRETRKDPNVLLPGDRITVPPIRSKSESGATEMRHRFVRRGEPALFRLCVLDEDRRPRGSEPYLLTIDGREFPGVTSPDGLVEVNVPGNARRGQLKIGQEVYDLCLHALDPVESVSGMQARLKNLGFYAAAVDGRMNDRLRESIRMYQRERGLAPTGQMDEQTCRTLRAEHRS